MMGQHYSVRLHDHEQWVVSVDDEDILMCSRLIVALRAVKEATNLMSGHPCDSASVLARPKVEQQPLSEYTLGTLQLVAFDHGWHIEQQGEKYYLRSLEPETFQKCEINTDSHPTNHLAYFKTLAEIHRFLTGE